jgi:DNA-binding NtrC family response regulator
MEQYYTPKALLVDDEPRATIILDGELSDAGFEVTALNSSVEAIELLQSKQFDVVITDLSMPEKSGLDVLEAARDSELNSDIGAIVITAHASIDSAVTAGKMGVAKYLEKPFKNDELVALAQQVCEYTRMTRSKKDSSEEAQEEFQVLAADIVFGSAASAKRMNDLIRKVAPTDATALLTGASGSGKEVAAQMIHALSKRAKKPFVAVNCAALAENLLESELFGHVKGAFTGATDLKRGRFELADGGTLFLDEIGETSGALQTKLLRVLEERTFSRVGAGEEITCNVRVITATNRDLQTEIAKGTFREDLFFRLNVFPIPIPSLAERKADIPEFVNAFLQANGCEKGAISDKALGTLCDYHWPGNIRELRNVIERAVILSGGEQITPEHLSVSAGDTGAGASTESGASTGLADAEREMITKTLRNCNGNKTIAAEKLGITRRKLYSRMKILGIEG